MKKFEKAPEIIVIEELIKEQYEKKLNAVVEQDYDLIAASTDTVWRAVLRRVDSRLLRAEEIAKKLGLSTRTVKDHIKEKDIEADMKVGYTRFWYIETFKRRSAE